MASTSSSSSSSFLTDILEVSGKYEWSIDDFKKWVSWAPKATKDPINDEAPPNTVMAEEGSSYEMTSDTFTAAGGKVALFLKASLIPEKSSEPGSPYHLQVSLFGRCQGQVKVKARISVVGDIQGVVAVVKQVQNACSHKYYKGSCPNGKCPYYGNQMCMHGYRKGNFANGSCTCYKVPPSAPAAPPPLSSVSPVFLGNNGEIAEICQKVSLLSTILDMEDIKEGGSLVVQCEYLMLVNRDRKENEAMFEINVAQ